MPESLRTAGPRILIIDDDRQVALALRIRLCAAGYELSTAHDGTTGLACAAATPPDIIVLDVRMPDIDGFEVCRRLKSNPRLESIPVVFLSANAQERARASALAAGGVCFLEKPFDAPTLLDTLETVLTVEKRIQ